MKRTEHRLSLANIENAYSLIDKVFVDSPQFVCKGLSDRFDLELIAKIETLNPIRSFKGRGSEVLASKAARNEPIICASAGNFGQAMAFSCTKRGIDLTVYASKNANPLKIERMRSFGARVVLSGYDFDEAKATAKARAKEVNARFVEDSNDIETLEGAGTIGLELLKLPCKIDVLLIALGNGALFNGIGRVIKACNPKTKLIAVQAEGAPAMVDSIKAGKMIAYNSVDTISDGIAVRLPVQQALDDLELFVDDTILVSDDATIKSMKLIHEHLGIVAEPSGSVGIAAIMENVDLFKGKTVATIICGGNLTQEQIKKWIM